jgi:GT2 family glycosyltransferase
MKSNSIRPDTPPERKSELSELIDTFTTAHDAGDFTAALRAIDRARRLASDNPEIGFLHGRLLLSLGAFEQATQSLAEACAGRAHPEYEAAYISALLGSGLKEPARQRLDRALALFAVTPGGALAQAARQVVEALMPHVRGWIGLGRDLNLHGELVGQIGLAKLEIAGDAFGSRIHRLKCPADRPHFAFEIPGGDIGPGHVTVRLHDTLLLGGKRDLPPDFGLDGRITLSKDLISGWASLRWDSARPLTLIVSGENGFSMSLKATPDPTQLDRQLFSFARADCAAAGNSLTVQAVMPDGTLRDLPVSPFLIGTPRRPAAPRRSPEPRSAGGAFQRKIDIVIPVYSGVEDTVRCIRSVIDTVGDRAEIIVIDDASPDPAMAPQLERIAAAGEITVLRNPRNLGFPATANRGMLLHPDRDIVLLNSDTEVFGNWLDRLQAAAYSAPDIASVTPLTNSGSIASYPDSEHPDSSTAEAEALDRLAADINGGVTIDIPTAVGFCMYVRRDTLDQVGLFDTDLFAKGYGEENDFCLRAAEAGWRHVLAADIYVRHAGSRSFGARRIALLERNLRLLNLRHRGYDAAIRRYQKNDPAHIVRRRLDEARLAQSGGSTVLLVSLALDGGVLRAVEERKAVLKAAGMNTILLTPDLKKDGICRLTVEAPGFDDLHYDIPSEIDALVTLLGRLKLDRIELHHFLDHAPALIEALLALDCPVDVTVHDYVWYCPRITLLDKAGRYCGEPDAQSCQVCVDRSGGRLKEDISIAALRTRSDRWLRSARSVAAPSPSVAERMRAKFPDVDFRVQALESDVPAPVPVVPRAGGSTPARVAMIGAIGDHKGYKTLLAMAQHAARHDLPLDFTVIGHTRNDQALAKTGRAFVTGRYREDEVQHLIAREKPDIILFLSVFPESWCYTLTHALRARIPVAGLELGAIADRLRGTAAQNMLFPPRSTPAELCDRLLQAIRSESVSQGNKITRLSVRNGPSRLPDEPDILFNAPTLPDRAKSSRTVMASPTAEPTASVSFLPLTRGLYLFSVRSAHAPAPDTDTQVRLPAMQVAAAPGTAAGHVEFMMGPTTVDGWLVAWDDQIVAKINAPTVAVALTSVLIPGMTPLEIEVQRLDQARQEAAAEAVPVRQETPPLLAAHNSLPLEVTAHIQNHGDMTFAEGQWAGLPDQHLWIESIAIAPVEDIAADMIEYKAITATGVETPWVSNGAPCGTRGIGVPITGFSLRARPLPGARPLVCEYGAICLSGATIGPVRNGAPCFSAGTSDPITAIWVAISDPTGSAATKRSGARPAKGAAKTADAAKKPAARPDTAAPSPAKSKKPPIGPRFSVFREPTTTEQE